MPVTTVISSVGTGGKYATPALWWAGAPADFTLDINSTTGAGSTASAVKLNASASTTAGAYVGNTLTFAGETRLITAYDAVNQIATVGSLNGGPATFPGVPAEGNAYNIGPVIWRGELLKQEFVSTSTAVNISGKTTSATCYAVMTAAPGASFLDHSDKATNPLRCDATKGATINVTGAAAAVAVQQKYTRIFKLQIANTNTGASGAAALVMNGSGNNCDVDQCITESHNTSASTGTFTMDGAGNTLRNSLVVQHRSATPTAIIAALINGAAGYNVTMVSTQTKLTNGLKTQYVAGVLKNVAIFNVTNATDGVSPPTVTSCFTDGAGAGFTVVALDGVFENTAFGTHDLRLKAGSPLVDVGVVDATHAATDILGTARPAGASSDVGAHEVPSAATPVSFSGPVPTRNGAVGSVASFTNAGFFAGSATPFTYSLQAGILPAGLTLNASTGIISGTPTTAGTQSGVVIRATDANNATADTNAYSIVIAASNAAPTFPGTIANITGTGGTAITQVNVSGQFSDTDALTYSASPAGTAWPSGLVVNSTTGIISGTVAASTTTGLRVRATDTAGQTVDSNTFNVTISAAVTTGTFVTDAMSSSGTLRASQDFTGTWFLGGVIGSAAGTATHFSGTTSAVGVATVPNLAKGAGRIEIAFSDGGRFMQEGAVA